MPHVVTSTQDVFDNFNKPNDPFFLGKGEALIGLIEADTVFLHSGIYKCIKVLHFDASHC